MTIKDKFNGKKSESQSKLVVTSPTGCNMCDYASRHPYHIVVTSITSDDEGWLAKGEGYSKRSKTHCPNCGANFEALIHAIPILCKPFNCPQCGKSETLQYKVNSLTTERHTFEFEVEIECKSCSKKRSLKKAIKELLKIIKLEVSPTGISVKNA